MYINDIDSFNPIRALFPQATLASAKMQREEKRRKEKKSKIKYSKGKKHAGRCQPRRRGG
jgi:hypothetical protein